VKKNGIYTLVIRRHISTASVGKAVNRPFSRFEL
jgi:hypothetical protein